MTQLPLPLLVTHDETFLKEYLQKTVRKPIHLTITNTATSMLSVRDTGDGIAVRLHRIFLSADKAVLDEIASFIRKRKGPTPHFRKFIQANRNLLPAPRSKKVTLKTQGNYFNLHEIYDSLNKQYFNENVSAVITWGRRRAGHAVRKRTLGSYHEETNTIRINPVLDSRRVPRYVIECVVYHEMLHAAIGTEHINGQRRVHTKKFKQEEKKYPYYEKALEWERKNL